MKNLKKMMFVLFFMVASVLCLSGCDFSGIIDDIGNNEGNDEETVNLEMTADESKAKLKELEKDGYLISIKTTSSDGESEEVSTYTIACKDDVMWVSTDDASWNAYKFEGSSIHFYTKDEGEWTYLSTLNDVEDIDTIKESFKTIVNVLLYMGNTYDGLFKKGKTATVASRNCQVYIYEISPVGGMVGSLLGGLSYKYSFYIDKETGLTLKYEVEGQYQNEEAKMTFEVTTFDTGSKVVAPVLPAPVVNDDPLTE